MHWLYLVRRWKHRARTPFNNQITGAINFAPKTKRQMPFHEHQTSRQIIHLNFNSASTKNPPFWIFDLYLERHLIECVYIPTTAIRIAFAYHFIHLTFEWLTHISSTSLCMNTQRKQIVHIHSVSGNTIFTMLMGENFAEAIL